MTEQTTQDQQIALQQYLALKISQQQYSTIYDELTTEQKNQVDPVIKQSMNLHQAILSTDESAKVTLTNKQLDRSLNELKKRFETTQDFEATLAANHLDTEQLKQALYLELRCETTLDYITRHCEPISNEEAERYYFMNLDKFKQPERRKARHILITINDDFEENTALQAKQRMKDILDQIDTVSFGRFATRHSECPTAMNEGQLGLVDPGQLHPELDAHLFDMKANSISPILESEAGFHLLYCEAVMPEHNIHFQQAKNQIIEKHLEQSRKKAQKQWMASILR